MAGSRSTERLGVGVAPVFEHTSVPSVGAGSRLSAHVLLRMSTMPISVGSVQPVYVGPSDVGDADGRSETANVTGRSN